MAKLFKLVSINVGGINNFHKRRAIFTWCRKRKADVIFLQETRSKEESEKQWVNEWSVAFTLPHKIANEPYVKAFQYKILNSILYTNTKLFKIGYSEHDKCTFCNNESETLHHLFFNCPHSNLFWKHLEKYYFNLTKQLKVLSLQEIIIGITASSCPLLNYLI